MEITTPKTKDAPAIAALIGAYSKQGLLLYRSEDAIFRNLFDFRVAKNEDGVVLGCSALTLYSPRYAEICSLAVSETALGKGIGRALVLDALNRIRDLGVEYAFALTYVDEFFKRLGFNVVDKDTLPHKIYKDCLGCPKFPHCDEIAVLKEARA